MEAPCKNTEEFLSGALDPCHNSFGSWLESFASLRPQLARKSGARGWNSKRGRVCNWTRGGVDTSIWLATRREMTPALRAGFGLMRDLTTTTGGRRNRRETILKRRTATKIEKWKLRQSCRELEYVLKRNNQRCLMSQNVSMLISSLHSVCTEDLIDRLRM